MNMKQNSNKDIFPFLNYFDELIVTTWSLENISYINPKFEEYTDNMKKRYNYNVRISKSLSDNRISIYCDTKYRIDDIKKICEILFPHKKLYYEDNLPKK